MDEMRSYEMPPSNLARMQVVHFGKIAFNLQFVALAVMLASVVSFVVTGLYYVMLLFVSLLTLGFIYAVYPGFLSWWSGGETLAKITETMSQSFQYTIPILCALSIASIVCLCFDKYQKHIARIVISVIIFVLATIILVAKLINKGGA